MRQLERQLVENTAILQRFDEENRQKECGLFAIADYESLKYEWDFAKHEAKAQQLIEQQDRQRILEMSNGGTVARAEEELQFKLNRLTAQSKETFLNSYALLQLDRHFCPRALERLEALCARIDSESFTVLRDSLQRLHRLLNENSALDAALQGIVAAAQPAQTDTTPQPAATDPENGLNSTTQIATSKLKSFNKALLDTLQQNSLLETSFLARRQQREVHSVASAGRSGKKASTNEEKERDLLRPPTHVPSAVTVDGVTGNHVSSEGRHGEVSLNEIPMQSLDQKIGADYLADIEPDGIACNDTNDRDFGMPEDLDAHDNLELRARTLMERYRQDEQPEALPLQVSSLVQAGSGTGASAGVEEEADVGVDFSRYSVKDQMQSNGPAGSPGGRALMHKESGEVAGSIQSPPVSADAGSVAVIKQAKTTANTDADADAAVASINTANNTTTTASVGSDGGRRLF